MGIDPLYSIHISIDEYKDHLHNNDPDERTLAILSILLENEILFTQLCEYLNSEANILEIIIGEHVGREFSKKAIIDAYISAVMGRKIDLDNEMMRRFKELSNIVSFNSFLKRKPEFYEIMIDQINYRINTSDMIEFLELPVKEYMHICCDSSIQKIYGIPKRHFVYATIEFFYDPNINSNRILPENIKNRLNSLYESEFLDIDDVNLLVSSKNNDILKHINIDRNLEESILSGLPENATVLEKVIYIYLRMCQIFSYDDEFFAEDEKGKSTLKHSDIEHINEITLKNNRIVCYEFSGIFYYFLDRFGIKFKDILGSDYGVGHNMVEFRTGDMHILADPFYEFLDSDFMHVKLLQPIKGLQCISDDAEKKMIFESTLSKVYNSLINSDKNTKSHLIESTEDAPSLLKGYTREEEYQTISLEERLRIIVNKLRSSNLNSVDNLLYVLQLRQILFTEKERNKNIQIVAVRDCRKGRVSFAVIIVLNSHGISDYPLHNTYYFLDEDKNIVHSTREYIQRCFDSGEFEYINEETIILSGIDTGNTKGSM